MRVNVSVIHRRSLLSPRFQLLTAINLRAYRPRRFFSKTRRLDVVVKKRRPVTAAAFSKKGVASVGKIDRQSFQRSALRVSGAALLATSYLAISNLRRADRPLIKLKPIAVGAAYYSRLKTPPTRKTVCIRLCSVDVRADRYVTIIRNNDTLVAIIAIYFTI